jgi:RimJ/RimL family protein N-acetyltransferase
MLDHISLAVCDVERSKSFYDAILAPLGYVCLWNHPDSAGYGVPGETDEPFAIRCDPRAINPLRGMHVAFAARGRAAVRGFYAAALQHGAGDDGAPRIHHEYGSNYFAAFVIDRDGYRLEAVCHEPQTTLVEVTDEDFAWMLGGVNTAKALQLPPEGIDSDIAAHVRATVRRLREQGWNGNWMIVFENEVVGLCGFKHPPIDGSVEIGYNVWPSRQRAGHASRAVAAMLRYARLNPAIRTITAETTTANSPSHRVLETNGFQCTGTRYDAEDGELILWRMG